MLDKNIVRFKASIKVDPNQVNSFLKQKVSKLKAKQQNIEQRAGMGFIYKIRTDIPLLTSRLRTSGYVQLKRTDKGSMIQFDPEDPKTKEHYALIQEINLNFKHRHGKALFLSDNIHDEGPYAVDMMRKQVYKELRN
jgi:hypothetical protein